MPWSGLAPSHLPQQSFAQYPGWMFLSPMASTRVWEGGVEFDIHISNALCFVTPSPLTFTLLGRARTAVWPRSMEISKFRFAMKGP